MVLGNYFFSSSGAAAYEIDQSLRFDGASGYLTRTNPASSGITNAYKWSYSFWLKHSDVSSSGTIEQPLLSGGNTPGAGRTFCGWGYVSSGRFWIGNYTGADYRPDIRPTDRVWRDPSAWEHFMLVYDTSESTNTDRIKIYSNGVRWEPTGGVGSTISSTQLFYAVNHASKPSNIGYDNILTKYFDGYMAEVHFVDGQALDQYDFGEFNNGVWRPIRYTGTYGSNGHYLKFDPSATNGIGHDHSGNGNNFTASGFTTSGTGTDVMSDTPTNNWCVMNPNDNGTSYIALSNGSLSFAATTTWDRGVKGTFAVSSGKWYWEYTHGTIVSSSQPGADLGVTKYSSLINSHTNGGASSTDSYILAAHDGELHNGSYTGTSYGSAAATGDIISIALDLDNGKIWWAKNGTWFNSGNPASGTNAGYTGLSGTFFPLWYWGISPGTGGVNLAPGFNFGQRDFSYTAPTNFLPLNTSNLPEPDIADGSEYFSTTLYTGVSGSQSVDAGMATDLAWIKSRSTNQSHSLTDRVRGNDLVLQSNETSAETSGDIDLTSTGVTIGNNNALRGAAGVSYVLWSWLAGGSTSTPSGGSIASTVSANTTAGFSIVSFTGKTYTGNSSTDTGTVAHGLGAPPSFYVVKARNGTSDWICYHSALGNTKYIELNLTNGATTNTGMWASTSPTDTVFTMGPFWPSHIADGKTMIAYCFAEVEGYSKFSSYTATGNIDGVFVYTGFKPAWLLIKQTTSTDSNCHWFIFDEARNIFNVVGDEALAADQNYLEGLGSTWDPNTAGAMLDILSNGFKIRTTSVSGFNVNGATYVYAAFASSPFGGDGVSPATAR